MTETVTTDVLVIGGGSAAARAALEASSLGANVTLVDKGNLGQSGTSPLCLNGVVAPVTMNDNPIIFYQDWWKTSCGIGDQNLIWEATLGATANFVQLLELGVDFHKESQGSYLLYQGAGHSRARGSIARRRSAMPWRLLFVPVSEDVVSRWNERPSSQPKECTH